MNLRDEIVWLAGLVEGEGSFTSRKRIGQPVVRVGMTDLDVIERAARVGRAAGPYEYKRGLKLPGRKTIYYIAWNGKAAAGLMMTLYMQMGQRRRTQIRSALQIWRARPARLSSKLPRLCTEGCGKLLQPQPGRNGSRQCRDCRNQKWREYNRRYAAARRQRLKNDAVCPYATFGVRR